MPNRRKTHWTAMIAIGLPLVVAGCAGTGTSRYSSHEAPAATGGESPPTTILALADKLSDEKNYGNAATMYRQAHENAPNDTRPLLGLGHSLLAIGANADAADAFGKVLTIEPSNLEALRGLGHARILLKQPAFAIQQYQTALKLAPNDIRSLNGLGVAQDMNGDHAGAQKTYKTVLALDPNDQPARNNLALSLALSGDEAGAIKILEELNKSASATTVNRQNLALVYGISGQIDDAARISRADLSAQQVRRNMAMLTASSGEEDREALLKGALGVELKGVQYSPAPRMVVPLNNLALSPANETPIYLSGSSGQASTLISIDTTKTERKPTGPIRAAASSNDEAWAEDWNEELIDAADIDPTAPLQLATIPSEPLETIDQPLPPSPAPAGTVTSSLPAPEAAPPSQTSVAMEPPGLAREEEPIAATTPNDTPAQPAKAEPEPVAQPEKPSSTPAQLTTSPASPSEPEPPDAPAVTVASSGAAKIYTIQLAAYRDEAEAAKGWQALTTDQGDLLNDLPHVVERADLGADKGIYFRLKAGAFSDIKAAKSLCKDLKVRSVDCMVVEATAVADEPTHNIQQSMALPDRPAMNPAR